VPRRFTTLSWCRGLCAANHHLQAVSRGKEAKQLSFLGLLFLLSPIRSAAQAHLISTPYLA
jgi:hypothetical protein